MAQGCAQVAGRRSRRRRRARTSSKSCLGAREPTPTTSMCSPIHSPRVRLATASCVCSTRLLRRTHVAGVCLTQLGGRHDRSPRVGGSAALMWRRESARQRRPAAHGGIAAYGLPGPEHGCAACCGHAYAMQCACSIPHACGSHVQRLFASGSLVRARNYVILKIAIKSGPPRHERESWWDNPGVNNSPP